MKFDVEQAISGSVSRGGAFGFDVEQALNKKKPQDRSVVSDVGKSVGGTVLNALGAIPTAGGRAIREGGEMLIGLSMDEARTLAEAEGKPEKALEYYEKSNRLNPVSKLGGVLESMGGWMAEKADQVRDSRSDEAKEIARQSTPSGDLPKPSTWSMGESPSVEGVAHVMSDVVGSLAPQVATAIATRGRSATTQMAAGGAVGASQIGGAAIQEANEYLGGFTDDKLREVSPVFRELEAKGYSPEDARTIITRDAENRAATYAAPVGLVGGQATAAILGKAGDRIASGIKGIGGKAAVLGALGATEEGLQEVGEGIATRAGINDATGTERSLTEGTFPEFVLGAAGGGGMGVGKGVAQGVGERLEARQAGVQTAKPDTANTPQSGRNPQSQVEGAPRSITNLTPAGTSVESITIEPTQPAAANRQAGRQTRPEVRLAELEILKLSRPLNEVEVHESIKLLKEIQARETDEGFGTQSDVGPMASQPIQQEAFASEQGAKSVSVPVESDKASLQRQAATDLNLAPRTQPPSDFWSFARQRGLTPGQIKVGTPEHAALKAEYEALKQQSPSTGVTQRASIPATVATLADTPATSGIGMGTATDVTPSNLSRPEPQSQIAQQTTTRTMQAMPAPLVSGIDPALQNRDRSRAASVAQMSDIAMNPDYMRLATSRTPDAGAPMVFAVGDDTAKIPASNLGNEDVAVMSDGQRVPFRYAVVDARAVEPSNFADGRANPSFSAELMGTIKALNNGRTAGLRAAYEQGTAGNYQAELIADAAAHGVPVEAIQRTPNPILVRVYSEQSNTLDMAAKSQGQGLGMSPTELAFQDAPLIDGSVLAVHQPGDVTSAANRDFVRAFVGKLNQSGQDVAGMMTADGSLSPGGRQRIQAALMQAAYGDADLVAELFDSLDTDIKAIGEALKAVAGEWANMRDSAQQGLINPEADVTDNLVQAVNMIRKARRERSSLYDLVRQPDLMTGETPDPVTVALLRLFYSGQYLTRAVGRDGLIESLRDYVNTSMGTTAGADMFGQTVTPSDILNGITEQGNTDAQDQTQEGGRGTDGRSDPGGRADTTRQADQRWSRTEGGRGTGEDRPGERENPAGTVGASDAQTEEGNEANRLKERLTSLRLEALPIVRTDAYTKKGITFQQEGERTLVVFKGEPIATLSGKRTRDNVVKAIVDALAAPRDTLTAYTSREVIERQETAEAAQREAEAADRKAAAEENERRERAEVARRSEAAADTFELGQDPMTNLTGQQDIFGATDQDQASQADTKQDDAKPAPRKPRQKADRADETKNEDVGAQLYANRRNFTGRGIKWEDVQGLNDTLKLKEVTKAKVWPRPNYEQLVADGMSPLLARMVKQVYDGISAGPTIRASEVTDEQLKRYIDTLAKIREGLFAFVNDKQAVGQFASSVLAISGANRSMAGPVSIIDMLKTDVDAKAVSEFLVRRVWPEEYAPERGMRPFSRGTKANGEVAIIGGNKALAALQFVRTDFSKWGADLSKGWPSKREAWEVQGYRVLGPDDQVTDSYEGTKGKRYYIRTKQGREQWSREEPWETDKFTLVLEGGRFAKQFDTREAAIEAAREQVKRKASAGQDIRGTNIEEAERTGAARREEGQDISSQALMDTFGFRGVNFGREGWINQAERQAYLNQAYDGLLDLAEILGVPPKAMSLNGALGIAFGAQGKGKFAAHFVAGVNEINLTKTKGAGTLAHEWGHALDHHFANQAGLSKDKEPFLSEHAYRPDTGNRMVFEGGKYVRKTDVPTFGADIRPEIVQAFRAIYQTMEKRDATPEEAQARTEAAKDSAIKRMDGWLAAARNQIASSTAQNKADLLNEFDQHAEKMREGDIGDGNERAGKQVYSARVAAIRNLIKDATGRLWSDDQTQGLQANAFYVRNLLGKQDADKKHEPQKVGTQYKQDSLAMDQEKGGKAYWSTPTEMFARAFELYVHDKLAEKGAINTFLTDAQRRAMTPAQIDDKTNAMARATGAKRDLYLYPKGQERDALREAFDKLVEAIETRETEQGVTMFSRGQDFAAEVDQAIEAGGRNDTQALRQQVSIGATTPAVLRMLGVEEKPVYTNRDMIAKMHLEHGVPKDQLKNLAGLLENPAMVFESDTQPGRFVVVTDVVVGGQPLVIAVEPNGKSQDLKVVYLPSAYPKDNANVKFTSWIKAGKLLYADKSRSRLLATNAGLQLPGVVARPVGFTPVKYKTEADIAQSGLSRRTGTGGMDVKELDALVTRAKAKMPNMPKVHVMKDPTTAPKSLREYITLQGAWGDVEGAMHNGELYLFASGLRDTLRAEHVLIEHEAAHYGLRAILGPSLKTAMNLIYANNPAVRKAATELQKRGKLSNAEAVEEVIVDMPTSELVKLKGWRDVVRMMAEFLGRMGYERTAKKLTDWLNGSLTDQERADLFVAELVHGARDFVAGKYTRGRPGSYAGVTRLSKSLAEDIAAQEKWLTAEAKARGFKDIEDMMDSAYPVFEKLAAKWQEKNPAEGGVLLSRSAENKTDASANPDIRFSRSTLGDQSQPSQAPQGPWQKAKAKALELTSPEAITNLLYDFQDKYIDLKRLRDHIKAIGGTINDLNDAYLREELYHKRLAKRTEDFLDKELRPLLADMRNRSVSLPELERYLHARHAPEANRVLAERNPTQAMIDAGKAKATRALRDLETQLQRARANNSATRAIETALEEARDKAAIWNGAQAFKGTEAERLSLSGMSDADSKAFIDGLTPRQREHVEALAQKVDAMQAKTLDTLEDYGLIDKATVNGWRSSYKHYVPLHRDEVRAESDRHPVGMGFSVKGTGMKSRVGSNEKVTNILTHIVLQRETALTRGEKNNVTKSLYLMAAQNPDESYWEVDRPPQVKTIDSRNGFVRTGVDPTYKNKPNVVMVRIGGKDQAIVFNERNPNAVRLAESMKNMDVGDLHVLLNLAANGFKWFPFGTRWFASVNTQYNPIFGLINFARDVQAAALNLSTTELAGKESEVASPKQLATAMRAIYRERRGKSVKSQEWARLWDEMQEVGGTTGYRDLFADTQARADGLVKELKALDRGQTMKAAHAVVDWLSDYNEVMENAVRLSAYKVALEQGMSKERAASLAKNLTVNFNRRGRLGRELGAAYAFFNAALQGTARMVETLRGPTGKKIMLGGVMLGAVNTLIGMAMMGGGDDEDEANNWEQIPEFIKERSIIIPLGREDYLTIPMPLGYHVFPNIGRMAVEFALGGSEKTAGSMLGKLMMILADSFNPLGSATDLSWESAVGMAAPTVVDPIWALAINKDWTGRPIYRENQSGLDPKPGHQMAKDSASTFSVNVSEAINRVTGGTEYRPGAWSPNPDQLDYVIGQLTGGLGRELMKVDQSVRSTFTGDELPPYKIPLAGRLYGNTRGPAGQSGQFYENVKLLNELENELKGRLRNNGDVQELRDTEPLLSLVPMANQYESRIRKLRDQRRQVVERRAEGYQDRVRELDEQIGDTMANLNKAVSKARKEAVQ